MEDKANESLRIPNFQELVEQDRQQIEAKQKETHKRAKRIRDTAKRTLKKMEDSNNNNNTPAKRPAPDASRTYATGIDVSGAFGDASTKLRTT